MILSFLSRFIVLLVDVISLAIIIRSVMSWFSPEATNRLAVILFQITEPFLAPVRRVIPRIGMLDFSPLVTILLLQLISSLVR